MPVDEFLQEAQRQLNICNACRYCEGYCAVFPALELRSAIREGDLVYLANLCHDCRNCYDACMFAPPHEFAINIPKLLAEARVRTYERYGWPQVLSRLVRRSVAGTAALVLAGIAMIWLAVAGSRGIGTLVSAHAGPGAFYAIVPYLALVVPALAISLYGVGVIVAGAWEFCNDTHGSPWDLLGPRALAQAAVEAATLRWMRGGGAGCYYPRRRGSQARVGLHALVFWGFLFAFVATVLAAVYQDLLDRLPPYPILSAPVLFGAVGGAMLVLGTTGLLVLKTRNDSVPTAAAMTAMDYAFLIVLDLVAITGMLLLVFRSTRAMGPLLVVHLGVLFGLYVTAPYGKFVHAVYRYLALVKRRVEEERDVTAPGRAGT
jgi:citrate/tricarballylate utilization protein